MCYVIMLIDNLNVPNYVFRLTTDNSPDNYGPPSLGIRPK